MTTENKIVIAGAGLIGTSLALSLKNSAVSIQILENHLPEIITQSNQDARPISLSYGSVCTLMKIGVWDELEKFACPILSVHVSEKGKFGFTQFSAAEQKVPALGYVVPFSRLQSALYHQAAIQENMTLTSIQSIEKIESDSNGAFIHIHSATGKSVIHADLFIAADGTHSTCRDLLSIAHTEKDSGDVAKIYQLQLSENHNNIAYERFTKLGVLAVLPLFENTKAQLVWTATPVISKKIINWTDDTILEFLQNTFEGRLEITSVKKSAQFPLKTILAEKQIAESAVLLGNAAHTIYPVAAQGFNLGLHDVSTLVDILNDALKSKKKINDLNVLKKYEAEVKKHQDAILCITNKLIPLFDLPLIGYFRGLGLLSMDLINPLKNRLAKRTMGLKS
ncbi:MAG: FAD-dependent monooxygenase [Gammaproteobacteria bacterium]|nr:FAD-dependent monooxygenase [Gammaproteobacteria bacterium]